MPQYIVYVSSGSYSNYSVNGIYVGPVNPKKVLGDLVRGMTDGVWTSQEEAELAKIKPGMTKEQALSLSEHVRKEFLPELLRAGFEIVDGEHAVEVWVHS